MIFEILAGIGAVTQGIGLLSQGNAANEAAKREAQAAEENAQLAMEQARYDELTMRVNAVKTMGRARANYGASGVQLEGSPLDILQESAANMEADALNIRHFGDLQARAYRIGGDAARTRGSAAQASSRWGAAASLLSGGAQIASYQKYSTEQPVTPKAT